MNTKRYLVLVCDGDTPEICDLPYNTLEEAKAGLKAEFERAVERAFNGGETPEYKEDGSCDCIDDGVEYYLHDESEENGSCFYVWDGDEYECRGSIREISIFLSSAETERAFREQKRRYLLMDAEAHLYERLGYDPDAEEGSEEEADNERINQSFTDTYGFSISEAINDSSDFFQLGFMADLFEKKRDCNNADNIVWDYVVDACLASLRGEETV